MSRFHAKDGVCFERVPPKYAMGEDTVRVLRVRGDNPLDHDAEAELICEMSLSSLASVFSFLSPGGENGQTFELAYRFLGGRP